MKTRKTAMLILFLFAAGMVLSAADADPQRRRRQRHSDRHKCHRMLSRIVNGHKDFQLYEADGFRFAMIKRQNENLVGLFTADYSQVEGYRGITNCLVLMELNGAVKEVKVVESEDTPPYVKRLIREGFLDQLVGLKPAQTAEVDAVSGATITCDAIRDSVVETLQAFLQIAERVDFSAPEPRGRTADCKVIAVE
ncbi:MAG: FMN-binding protein [Candidatus Aminicenantes bacterium]|nr:FMN-binding protein [Candidatus Aminicenantes bacterium]